MDDEIISTDVLIIGVGIAGIRAAIEAHKRGVEVVLVTKGPFGQDGAVTWMAATGYQAPLYPPDSVETHIRDSIRAGKSLSNGKLVEQFLKFAPSSVEELQSWGMRLRKKGDRFIQYRLPKNLLNEYLSTTFADFDKVLKRAGIDIREDGVEVGPAAHYVQGGCWIDERCRTSLPGLFIAGELGSSGKDGADRLAGNALPFCWAMGYIGEGEAAERAKSMDTPRIDESHGEKLKEEAIAPLKRKDGVMAWQIKGRIRRITSEHAIFARTKEGLTAAITDVEKIKKEDLPRLSASSQFKNSNLSWVEALEAKNMVTISEMVLKSGLMREESRGLHERADFPEEDTNWIKHIIIEKVGEEMKFTTGKVPSSL